MSDIPDKYNQNIVQRVGDRRLPQFHGGSVRCGILNEQARQLQEIFDAIVSTLDQRTLANARGGIQDVIGRIVGQARVLLNQAEVDWFGPDDTDGGPDLAPVWVTGAALTGNLPADDAEYLLLIISKIFKNHVQHGSIPEVLEFVRLLYGVNISLRKVGLSQIELIVPVGTPAFVVTTLLSSISDDRADNQHFLPHCPTVGIVGVMFRPVNPFAPDRAAGAPDIGEAAVSVI